MDDQPQGIHVVDLAVAVVVVVIGQYRRWRDDANGGRRILDKRLLRMISLQMRESAV